MAMLVTGGFDTFEAAIFGRQHPNVVNFLQQQFEAASAPLQGAAAQFMEASKAIYERVNNSDTMRMARAAMNRVNSLWLSDEIQPLLNLAHLQNAPLTMQRWIMAEPTIRNLYVKQAADGYSDTYVNVHGKDVGEYHYDYRRVMDGIVDLDANVEEDAWESVTYVEELAEGDRDLDLSEQRSILDTWEALRREMRENNDPTSKYNASL